jgi:ribonuclease VapC
LIIDTSAIIAVLMNEPERDRIGFTIGLSRTRRMSAATLLEAAMVIEGRSGNAGATHLDDLVAELRIEIIPFTPSQAAIARDAFRRFGKGRHAARLNFGDCIAYAAAKERGEPLLFKGADFAQTDVEVVIY